LSLLKVGFISVDLCIFKWFATLFEEHLGPLVGKRCTIAMTPPG